MWIGIPARMSVVHDSKIIPILTITLASTSLIKETLMRTIIDCIEIAVHFGGAILEKESSPKLLKSEVVGISATIIFHSVEDMLMFENQIRPQQ